MRKCREREPTKDTEVLIEKPPDRDRLGIERDAVDGQNILHGSKVNVSERSAKFSRLEHEFFPATLHGTLSIANGSQEVCTLISNLHSAM